MKLEQINRLLADHGFPLLAIGFLAVAAFGGALVAYPFELDNVAALSLAHRSNPLTFFAGGTHWTYTDVHGALPEYRPLAFVTVWVQEEVAGVHGVQYFAVGLVLLAAYASAVYGLVYACVSSRLAALVAAGALVIDYRVFTAVVWILERQTTMACVFGLLAMLLVVENRRFQPRTQRIAVFALLLAAFTSKESGVAFVVAVPLLAYTLRVEERKSILIASAGALAAYLLLRFGLASVTSASYCEDMGYFGRERRVCYDSIGLGARLEQHLYNVLATLVGTVWPSLFNGVGAWRQPAFRTLVVPTIVGAMAILGVARRPRVAGPLISLVLLNALLSFMLYRTRNQLVGMAGLYTAGGIGLSELLQLGRVRLRRWSWIAGPAALAVVFSWMVWHAATDGRQRVDSYRALVSGIDPCTHARQSPQIVKPDVVARIKRVYGLSDPGCER
jgi:hypothetical protein